MSLDALINRECVLILRSGSGELDEAGDETHTETRVDSFCELQQFDRDEQGDQGELSDTLWRLLLRPGTEIDTGDAVEVDGVIYELVGDPWEAINPRTQVAWQVEATVRRTAGPGEGS